MKVGLLKVGPSRLAPEGWPPKVGPQKVGLSKVGPQGRLPKVSIPKAAPEGRPPEGWPRKVGPLKVGLLKVGPLKVGPPRLAPNVGLVFCKKAKITRKPGRRLSITLFTAKFRIITGFAVIRVVKAQIMGEEGADALAFNLVIVGGQLAQGFDPAQNGKGI